MRSIEQPDNDADGICVPKVATRKATQIQLTMQFLCQRTQVLQHTITSPSRIYKIKRSAEGRVRGTRRRDADIYCERGRSCALLSHCVVFK